MTQIELTDLIIQSATSLLVIIGAAVLVTGIVTIMLLIEWKLFPSTKPFKRLKTLEVADRKNYNITPYEETEEDNVIFNH